MPDSCVALFGNATLASAATAARLTWTQAGETSHRVTVVETLIVKELTVEAVQKFTWPPQS